MLKQYTENRERIITREQPGLCYVGKEQKEDSNQEKKKVFSKEEESGEMRPENCNEVWDGNWMAWKREEIIREKKVNKYPF